MEWTAQRRAVGVDLRWLAPVSVLVVLFKLAISDGGRHLPSLTLAQTAVFLILVVLIARGAAQRVPLGRYLLGMATLVTVSAIWSVRPEASIRTGLLWLLYLGIAVITASTVPSAGAARRFVDAAVAIAGWLSLIALFMFWGNSSPGMRWYSTFYWPNPFAAFLLLVLPVELVRSLHAHGWREAVAHGAISVLLGTSFILTYSRGAWLTLLAVSPVMLLLLRPLSWWSAMRRWLVIGALVAVAVVLLTHGLGARTSSQGVLDRAVSAANVSDTSLQGRLNFWHAAAAIFRDHPVLGTGAGTFGAVHAAYQRDVRFYASDAHNLYMQTLAEMGVLGLVALLLILGSIAVSAVRLMAQVRGGEEYPLIVGVVVGVLAFLLHSGVDMDWRFPANPALMFALVGVLVWYDRTFREPVGRPDSRHGLRGWSVVATAIVACALIVAQVFQTADRAFLAGQALARSGQWAASAVQYARASRLNPLSARYRGAHAVAVAQVDPTQVDAAAVSLRSAMALDRMNASYPLQLARLIVDRAHATSAQLREAEALVQQALTLDPWNRPEAYRLLARLYLRQGRMADADDVYRRAIARYVGGRLGGDSVIYALFWPEVVGLFLDAADVWARRGNTPQAVEVLEALLAEDPRTVPAVLRLSTLYVALGRDADARAVLQRTTAYVSDNEDLKAALRALP